MRLLSRYAEAFFWLARYLERAASLARVIEMQSSYGGSSADESDWVWLIALHSDEARFAARHDAATNENIIKFYVHDIESPGSLRHAIHAARENARALRPHMPLEMWVQLNEFYNVAASLGADDLTAARLPRTCAKIRSGCLAQVGVAESTLYRDEGFRFFKLGMLIERADQTSRLLDVKFAQRAAGVSNGDPRETFVFWSTILRTAAAYQAFRRMEPSGGDPERIARFLILNANHPRAIAYCAREIAGLLGELRGGFSLQRTGLCLEQIEILQEGLEAAGRDPQLVAQLHSFNDWVQRSLTALSSEIGHAFFGYAKPSSPQPPLVSSQSQSQA
jgi:uncharacterized alpha-E superfamily protein